MILIDPDRTQDYILLAQRDAPAEDQFKFHLRVLSARRWANMVAEEVELAKQDGERSATLSDTNLLLLRYGCRGWAGPAGSPQAVLDDRDRLDWRSLDMIPAVYRAELADAVWQLNTVFQGDVGKSPQS